MRTCREKRISWDGDTRKISWLLHTKRGAIEFHITVYSGKLAKDPLFTRDGTTYEGEPCYPFGFEVHSRTPPSYDDDAEPDHDDCTVLGGRCWHDGSSLAASEFFTVWDQSDEDAFRECKAWADSHLSPTQQKTEEEG